MKNLTFFRKIKSNIGILCSCLLLSAPAIASSVLVENGYIRATIPGTTVSSAYMDIINNTSEKLVLIGASAQVSDRVEIHQHVMEDGMMKMRQRDSLEVVAGEKVILQPASYHLMIFNLKSPLSPNDNLSLTLHFKDADDVEITLPVKSIKRQEPKEQAHHHHH